MKRQPFVSVLMTAYNRQQFIAEAIESVVNCTYSNIELIIVDDCSTDDTLQVVERYAAKDHRIKVYANEANLGDYPNRNKAASYAEGEYIVIIDSDDWMFKDALSKWVSFMQQFSARFGMLNQGYFDSTQIVAPAAVIQTHFFEHPLLMNGPGATIIKNDYFKEIGGFPELYGPANDMYYNLKAASRTATVFITEPLGDYRRHEGQEINNKYSYLYNNYRYLNDALNELDLSLTSEQLNYLHQKNKRRFVINGFNYLKNSGNFLKTIKAISKAKFTFPDFLTAIFNRKYNIK